MLIARTVEQRNLLVQEMEKSGYRFVGKHSAVKICHWTKQSIRGKNFCYKCSFYGIESHRCVQMSPTVFWCNFNCPHCWRQHRYTLPPKDFREWDEPSFILDECIKAQLGILEGFWGSGSAEAKKVMESMMPKHVAISLAGEPTFYPYLPEFIDEILRRNMTAYLVTNGTNPEMIEALINHQPTNLYISFYGPTPEMYKLTTASMIPDFWEKVNRSIMLFPEFDCNTVFRLTLTKGFNFSHPEKYAEFIEKSNPKFVECKGFMAVGGARDRVGPQGMMSHEEMMRFAKVIEENTSYRIINQKEESCVVLLAKEGTKEDALFLAD